MNQTTLYFLVAVGCLFLEFAAPGIGVFSLLSLLFFLASLYYALGATAFALQVVLACLVLGLIAFFFLVRQFGRGHLMSFLTLSKRSTQEAGYQSACDYRALLGRSGVATTTLRPAGTARIGDHLYDVVTEGVFVPAETPVVVTRIEGVRIVVRASAAGARQDTIDAET